MPWAYVTHVVARAWHTTPMAVEAAPIDAVYETLKVMEIEAEAERFRRGPAPRSPRR